MDAVVFPGQGSQKPGMGVPWVDTPSWEIVARVGDVVSRDVASLLLDADAPTLQATRNAQIAAFALGLVVLDTARRAGLTFGLAAGHSLGEYTALVAAGVLSLEDATTLVGERAEAMQSAAEERPGTMAAVLGLDPDAVAGACARADGNAWVANDNAPGQIVIAGTPGGIEVASAAARDLGAKVRPLAVGGAFHTPLMASAQTRLDAAVGCAHFADATVEVVANVDATGHRVGSDWPGLLSRQLCSPVRWRESVTGFRQLGVTRVVELGAGAVLGGMIKRIDPDLARASISSPAEAGTVTFP